MIDQFVTLCLKRRQVVWLIAILMSIFGYSSWKALKIEAYPDIADVSSQVITQYPGHAAEEVEEQVTVPLERELNATRIFLYLGLQPACFLSWRPPPWEKYHFACGSSSWA
jgi:Cu/Ag efflux pump CusA